MNYLPGKMWQYYMEGKMRQNLTTASSERPRN